MRFWVLSATLGLLLAAAAPAAAAGPVLAVQRKVEVSPVLGRALAAATAAPLPIENAPTPAGLRVTTAIGGAASTERIEGRLETRTKLVFPQVGCWRTWTRGFFLGLELGWSVASSAPTRTSAADARGGGFGAVARPTTSLVHFGWTR